MADWYKNLYVGKSIKSRKRKILRMLERGRCFPELYLITQAANGRDQLDILEASRYLLNSDCEERPAIIGISLGRREALELVAQIAEDAFSTGYGGDLKAYLKGRE